MVLSGFLIKLPYWLIWQTKRLLGLLQDIVVYIDYEQDYSVVENILPFLEHPYQIVARNKMVADKLREKGLNVDIWPSFPRMVILTRHAFHRYPLREIKKIGLRHGPYHFKKMISAEKYNQFSLFLFTSREEAKIAKKAGIQCAASGGYSKLDTFRRTETIALSHKLSQQPGFTPSKKTLLFTATWDGSGISAVDKWVDHLSDLAATYNVLVSLHPMMSDKIVDKIANTEGIFKTHPDNLFAYMLIADFLISDTSSIIAEFCALDKPIITFKLDIGYRLTNEISQMISDISLQINELDELNTMIGQYQQQPLLKSAERKKWNNIFFDDVRISHGQKAANVINKFVSDQIG